ncbi:diguanylate cyclase (GGDEF)-like protein [Phyllobacterium sp. 1468]|uniref:diguanylate cyclase domain-containing protein n=1 Tax=Phyllobacterium sp. 1468 TaxID=2817759 RepID=UPI002855F4F1|nr:diguanylate cyclase [Phyllobacterium sp. 1468]MDR6633999.1 diguanylate cyclase (GGDEF)-like protein [Phyllobacterium sp. 1468]
MSDVPLLESAIIARLKAELQAKECIIRDQATALEHSRKIFARASVAARIGVWECSLPDETLHWTDVVFDIFDLPRGSDLDRSQILECYAENTVKELQRRRKRAIEDRSGFEMDAEIITVQGNRRWIRITATVESENDVPVRIFGMKQDITEQKILLDRTRYLADFDLLTGLANRSQFQMRLADLCKIETGQSPRGALLLIDLDGFKIINDSLGHPVGDECLKEVANRLLALCHETEVVARIGGDEFAILLGPQFGQDAITDLARRIVGSVSRPLEFFGQSPKLGASVGIALIDDSVPSDVVKNADTALYAAKAAGRNTFQVFDPARTPDEKAA